MTPILRLLLIFLPFYTFSTLAQPLKIPDYPLVVASTVEPNIVFLMDDSGSMETVVVAKPFDDDTFDFQCPENLRLSNESTVYTRLKDDGAAYFVANGLSYVWGKESTEGLSIPRWGVVGTREVCVGASCFDVDNYGYVDEFLSKRCFDKDTVYRANLTYWGNWFQETNYSGNFLNWYYSNTNQSGFDFFDPPDGEAKRKKKTAKTRMSVAIDAASSLMKKISKSRVGLFSFHSNESDAADGAELHVPLAPILDNRSSLLTELASLKPGDATPLAEALEGIGRYYLEGFQSSLLRLPRKKQKPSNLDGNGNGNGNDDDDDDDDTPSSVAAEDIFAYEPKYHGKSKPTKLKPSIEYSCQSNFAVTLTDGLPTLDANVSGYLQNYDPDGLSEYFLEDVALALKEMDLRPDLDHPNGLTSVDNVVSYFIGFADSSLLDSPLLPRAAENAGTPYLNAINEQELNSAMEVILSDIRARVGTQASVAFNSAELSTKSALFLAQFSSDHWAGDIVSYPLQSNGALAPLPNWSAAKSLDQQDFKTRNIFTSNQQNGIPFVWDSLSELQKRDLGFSLSDENQYSADKGKKVLDFIWGDRSEEGSEPENLRVRASRLGDIVHSTPVYVGSPEMRWPDFSKNNLFGSSQYSYSSFKFGMASQRTPVIYSGANDGMLHGFYTQNNTSTNSLLGEEAIAYIPNALFDSSGFTTGMHYLADQRYQHKFYVDLTPIVSDVFIPRVVNRSASWRTLLIGGLRSGGKGLFALDVTDPNEFAKSDLSNELVLWEFTDNDDDDLGYVFGPGTIAMMPNGRWALIVGNGYNNSGSGEAKLFILFLDGGLDGSWTENIDYIKISTGVGNIGNPNGLSMPRVVDINGDAVADLVYAGDLQGNLWAFDVSSVSPVGGTASQGWRVKYSNNGSPQPLVSVSDSNNTQQPITSPPVVLLNNKVVTTENNEPNVFVLFGTGRFIETDDIANNLSVQAYYGVWDKGDSGLNRSNLEARNLVRNSQLRTITGDAVNWSRSHGWYFDLLNNGVNEGERVVSESSIRGKVLFFNTMIPEEATCSENGSGWLMSLDPLTGLAPEKGIFDTDDDGNSDQGFVGALYLQGLPNYSGFLGDYQYTPSSNGKIERRKIDVFSGYKTGRLSWEERLPN